MFIKIWKKKQLTEYIYLLLFLFTVSIAFSIVAVYSHVHFETFGWDLGYFDQLVWKVSQGIYPFSTLSKVNLLAGHFAPILFLYAPLYWIWSDPRILLILQSFLMVFAAFPLYLLSKNKTNSVIFSLGIVLSYLFFQGTQWSILNEFHEATIAPLFIAVLFWSLEKNKKIPFWFSIVGLLATKEEMALLLSAIGISIFLYFRRKTLGMTISVLSAVTFFMLVIFVMPKISETGRFYQERLSMDTQTPSEFIQKIIYNPTYIFTSFVTPPQKIIVFIISLLSFGLLPLFAPVSILIPLIEQFFMRFIYTGPQFTFWQNINHHAAVSAILLAIASVYAGKKLAMSLKKIKNIYMILGIILVICTLSQDVYLKNPLHSLFKKSLYTQAEWMANNYSVISQVPKEASVAVQNSIFPHVSRRDKAYLLPEIGDAEFILVDLHDGRNKFSPLNYAEMKKFIQDILSSKKYSIYYQKGEAVLLKKSDFTSSPAR